MQAVNYKSFYNLLIVVSNKKQSKFKPKIICIVGK